jgi:hypothetical protein
MAEFIAPMSATGTQRVMDAFSQGQATGRIPSRKYLDRLIQSELDAAYNNALRSRTFSESTKQFDISQRNQEETAAANRRASTMGSLGNLAVTGGMMYALSPDTPGKPGIVDRTVSGVRSLFGGNETTAIPQTTTPQVASAAPGVGIVQPSQQIQQPTMQTVAPNAGIVAGSIPLSEQTMPLGRMFVDNTPSLSIAGDTTLATTSGVQAGAAPVVAPSITEGVSAVGEIGSSIAPEAAPGMMESLSAAAGGWTLPAAAVGSFLGGKIAQSIGESIGVGGERERNIFGSTAGGALAGASVAGYPGAIVGGAVGFVSSLISSLF